MKIKAVLALLLLFCLVWPTLAQDKPVAQPQLPTPPPPQQPSSDKDDVIKITTNLVQVDVVVTKGGKVVPNLKAEDFELFEDGKRQAITSFAYISNVPNTTQPVASVDKKKTPIVPYGPVKPNEARRTMAFVVDDLALSADSMYQVKRQLRKFIEEQMQPNDLIAIVRTGGELGALQQFTNDKRLLTRAVDRLRWNICNRIGISVFRPVSPLGWAGGSVCGYRSIYSTLRSLRFIVESMGYLPGRKSMVLLSDSLVRESQDEYFQNPNFGVVRDQLGVGGSRSPVLNDVKTDRLSVGPDAINHLDALQKIAEKAIRSSVVIYSVDTQGLQYTGVTAADAFTGGPQQMNALMSSRSYTMEIRREGGELIAKQTGGFQVRNSNSYGFDRIMDDQSGYYLLGYRPTGETFNRKFHHLKAKVKGSGLNLRTRLGFYGVTEEEAERFKPTTRDNTNLALASPFGAQDINLDLTSFFVDDPVKGPVIRSFVYIDAKDLSFTKVDDRNQGSIELHGVAFGENGAIAQKLVTGATLNLKDADYQQAITNGLGLGFDMPVKGPGDYQVRVATRDRTSMHIGSVGQFVMVPDLKNKRLAVSGVVLGEAGGDQMITNPGTRHFKANSDLLYAFDLYNATDQTGKLRNLTMQVVLLRDGKTVFTGPEQPISTNSESDLKRLYLNGTIRLAPELEPGPYYLQVFVRDKDAKEKDKEKEKALVVQWADFEIEKAEIKN